MRLLPQLTILPIIAVCVAPLPAYAACKDLTYEKYAALKHGMTIDEADNVIGCKSIETSSTENATFNFVLSFREWGPVFRRSGPVGIDATFKNGGLDSKMQVGLSPQ
jgi:hypothetical protein